jgi:energy-coupling factor transport system substrate-specific component
LAIFAVLYIVVIYAIGMIGVISPLVWLLIVPVTIIVGGVPYLLFLTRVKHAGMVALFAVVVGLFYLLSGNTWLSTVAIIGLGLLAELISWFGRYRSRWAAILTYTVFGLGFLTQFLPLLIDREAYFNGPSWEGMGDDYRQATNELLSAPVMAGLAVAILAAGFLGGLLGSALLKKHFVKAGLA